MSIEYDITSVGGGATPKAYVGFFNSASQGNTGLTNYEPNATGHMKTVYNTDGTVQCWLDTTLMTDVVSSSTSPTLTDDPVYLKLNTGGNRTFTIKNMKIKPL